MSRAWARLAELRGKEFARANDVLSAKEAWLDHYGYGVHPGSEEQLLAWWRSYREGLRRMIHE